jgi:hypothetical protein
MSYPYSAYYDASGSASDLGTRPLVVAGVLAKTDNWPKFAVDWNRLLESHRVSFLHTTDLMNGCRQFDGWTEERKQALVRALLEVASNHVERFITIRVVPDDFRRVSEDYVLDVFVNAKEEGGPRKLSVWNGPYSFAVQMAMLTMEQSIGAHDRESLIVAHLILSGGNGEGGNKPRAQLLPGLFNIIAKADDAGEFVAPLQLADYIGNVNRKAIDEVLRTGNLVDSAPILELRRTFPGRYRQTYFDERGLRLLIADDPGKYPRRADER